MVGPSGLEPPTSRLSVVRSSQLSYGPILDFSHYGCFLSKERNGGDKRDRTVDPLLAKQVLSQLSYTPIFRRPAPSKLNNVSYSTSHQTSDLRIAVRDPVTLCLFATQPKPSDSEDKQIAFHAILVCLLRSSLSLLLSTAPRFSLERR